MAAMFTNGSPQDANTADRTLDAVQRLAGTLGAGLAVLLITLTLTIACVALYLLLDSGHKGLKLVIPYLSESLRYLVSELRLFRNTAIRVEMSLHVVLALLMAFCTSILALHSVAPWVRPDIHHVIVALLASSFVLFAVLCIVSIRLAIRLGSH
jgi:hypothetical protein